MAYIAMGCAATSIVLLLAFALDKSNHEAALEAELASVRQQVAFERATGDTWHKLANATLDKYNACREDKP